METQEVRLAAYKEAWEVLGGICTAEIKTWVEGDTHKPKPSIPTPEEVLLEARKIYSFILGN